jgi:hypothetical protein
MRQEVRKSPPSSVRDSRLDVSFYIVSVGSNIVSVRFDEEQLPFNAF